MTIAIKDAVILWHDHSARVGVTTQEYGVDQFECENGGSFDNSNGNCASSWTLATDGERLDQMVELFCWMADVNGVDVLAIQSAFLHVNEWRNAYCDKKVLDHALLEKRTEMKRRQEHQAA